jgi:hypothetical protein
MSEQHGLEPYDSIHAALDIPFRLCKLLTCHRYLNWNQIGCYIHLAKMD